MTMVDASVLGDCPACGSPISGWTYAPAIEEGPPVDGDVARFTPCGHTLTGSAAHTWRGERDARALPFSLPLREDVVMSEPANPTEAEIRRDERRKVAEELRNVAREQDSWLWFELGEGALWKVAGYIEPKDTPEAGGLTT